jgi:hypothetical protein
MLKEQPTAAGIVICAETSSTEVEGSLRFSPLDLPTRHLVGNGCRLAVHTPCTVQQPIVELIRAYHLRWLQNSEELFDRSTRGPSKSERQAES